MLGELRSESDLNPCKKTRLRQEAIPALKWGQSWNMTGSFKMLATTEAAITLAICFHFLLEYWVSSTKSLMPLTIKHSVLKSWAATCTPEEKKKPHSCLLTTYEAHFLSILTIIVQSKLTSQKDVSTEIYFFSTSNLKKLYTETKIILQASPCFISNFQHFLKDKLLLVRVNKDCDAVP